MLLTANSISVNAATVGEIMSNERVAEITEEVVRKNTEGALNLEGADYTDKVRKMTAALTTQFVERQIQIPPIEITRAAQNVGVEYQRFELNLAPFGDLKPIQQNILVRELLGNKRHEQGEAKFVKQQPRLNNYIILELGNLMPNSLVEDIDLLDYLAEQVVAYIKTYANDNDVEKILFFNKENIAKHIFEQAENHKSVPKIELKVKGFENGYKCIRSRPAKLLGDKAEGEQHFRNAPKALSKIRSYVYEGFEKSLSSKAKFDSNTERQLTEILEDAASVLKWERLSNEQAIDAFNLRYKKENEGLVSYCPDFVVETSDAKYIVETKAYENMTATDVQAKAEIAKRWCAESTKYESAHDGKPWVYMLVPHNEFDPTRTWEKLVADWSVK
jgi:type III restriction enzyme